MSRNASGTYTLPTGNPVVSGTDITVTWGNNTMNDIATEMTDSLSRSGKGGMLAPLTFVDGSVTVPGISWVSDANTGFYRIGADNMAMTAGGVQIVDYANNAFTFSGTTDTAATGPIFSIFRNSASPADADLIGDLRFDGEDSAGNKTTYASVSSQIDDVTNATEDGTLLVKTMTAGTLTTQLDISSALVNITPATTIAGLTTIASLKGTGAVTITDILDEDNMASNSATKLATQQSIKAYVDSSVGAYDTLSEVLANGNTSGSTDLVMNSGQKITTNTIDETTSASGVTIDSVLVKDSTVKAGSLTIGAGSITDSSGAITFGNENLTTTGNVDANGVEFDSLSGTGAVAITDIKDEDNMASNSATMLATQQSIKSYVDAQVGTVDTLSEVLAIGNTTGGTDVSVSTDDKVQFRDAAIYINSSTDGQLDIVADTEIQIAATTIDINGAVALNGAITGATNITLSGELDAATGDFSGDVDVDGTLEADAITLGGTALGSLYSPIAGSSSIVTTGALNSGSITSGFGTINNGASTITTTGALGAGAATFGGDVIVPVGSVGSPSLTFSGDTDTGIYHRTANTINIATGGVQRLEIDSAGNAIFAGDVIVDTGANAASITINSPSQTWSGGENLGELNWYTEDTSGAGPANVAAIKVTSTGSNTLPLAAMVFQTSAANATATTALTLDSAQDATFAGDVAISGAGQSNVGGAGSEYSSGSKLHVKAESSGDIRGVTLSRTGQSAEYSTLINADKLYLQSKTGGTETNIFNISTAGNATFTGSISKASGSFKIPHPLPELNETHNLVHSFVESPRAENLYSGMATLVDGTASVNIDTHSGMTEGTFEALNTLLTHSSSNESGYSPVKCSVVNNVITINCQDATSTDKVYWEVRGERKDQHMIDTEWTDDEGHVIVEPEVVAETETEAEAEA